MKTKYIWLFVVIIIISLIIGCYFLFANKKGIASKEKVNVQASWLLNGEFASLCSASVNGNYNEEGLDVRLFPGGPSGASFILATNSVAQNSDMTIGIEGDMVPLIRGITKTENEKLKVKAFASLWNQNPYGFFVKDESPLTSLRDLATKRKPDGSKYKIGVTSDSVIQNAIAKDAGVSVGDLSIVIVGYDATPFLTNQVDAIAGYWTTQAYEIEKAGIKYRFLPASELIAFNQPSMVAVASEKTLKEKPEILEKWLRATLEGEKFIVSNPEKAAEQVLDQRCGGPTFNKEQENWLITKSIPEYKNEKPGWIDEDQVSKFAEEYFKLGQIPYAPKTEDLVDYSILNRIYGTK